MKTSLAVLALLATVSSAHAGDYVYTSQCTGSGRDFACYQWAIPRVSNDAKVIHIPRPENEEPVADWAARCRAHLERMPGPLAPNRWVIENPECR